MVFDIYLYIYYFMSNRFSYRLILVLLVLLLLSFGFNIWYAFKPKDIVVREKTTVIEKCDTIRDTVPLIKKEKIISLSADTVFCVKYIHDGFDHSKVIASIPITQKEYSDDSTYTAWISGYKPNLDSINVYRKNIYVTKEVFTDVNSRKRFGFGPVLYIGYNAVGRRFDYGVGIGVTYSIFRW